MEYKDSKVSSVNQLYEPTDGKEVVLQSSASASLFFEWESAKAGCFFRSWLATSFPKERPTQETSRL